MHEFKPGDLVYHSFYGPGAITSTQTLDVSGVDRLYYIVELALGSTLMIPTRETSEVRLHPLIRPEVIQKVLLAAPELLSDDYRQRREHVEGKVNSGDPAQVAEVFRDMAWREHTAHLSNGDRQLMRHARKVLTGILLMQPDGDAGTADRHFDAMFDQATRNW